MCNVLASMSRERGAGLKLFSKAGDPQTEALSERKEIICFQKKQLEQVIWGKKWKDTTSVIEFPAQDVGDGNSAGFVHLQ